MQNLQQTVFSNFNSQTPYNFQSKKITDKHLLFPKYRYQELQNQFELVDLHDTGFLSQSEIITYLTDKYEWVNVQILRNLFSTMEWKTKEQRHQIYNYHQNEDISEKDKSRKKFVSKEQFCEKYLHRQKTLYHEIHGLNYFSSWQKSLKEIYNQEILVGRPRVYVYLQILKIELYFQGKLVQWVDIKFNYQNHDRKVSYEIVEASHDTDHPSFEVWLPSQKDHFFLKFQFVDLEDNYFLYGQSYINFNLQQKMKKNNKQELTIVKNGQKVGICQVEYRLEPDIDQVNEELAMLKQRQSSYKQIIQQKTKQFEYLSFLWGIRYISPHKITKLEATKFLYFRIVMLVILGFLGLGVNVLGRCEPISIILAFLMVRIYDLVMAREEKFYIAWIIVAGIFLDIAWIWVASQTKSQINFIDMSFTTILTYFLVGTKAIFFLYMLLQEKALTSRQRDQR